MNYSLANPLFQKAKSVMKQIESHGYEAYFVGGCVRDTLLNLPIHDIDIATSARPEEVEAIFSNTIDLGKKHGTVIVVWQQETYEITTFRTEDTYSDYRHPDNVKFVRDLQEDTLRRDFTINALAFDIKGKLYDYHGGKLDLDAKVIRAVGNPMERFHEDALRIFRAIRFASQLGFEVDGETFRSMKALAKNLNQVSMERIRVEMTKFLQGDYFANSYQLLIDSRIYQHLPMLNILNIQAVLDQLSNKYQAMIDYPYVFSEAMSWALLLMELPYQSVVDKQHFLKVWTHSNQLIKDVKHITELIPVFETNQLSPQIIYHYPNDILFEVEQYMQAIGVVIQPSVQQRLDDLPIKRRNDMAVNGKDIMALLNLKKGQPIVGELLAIIEERIILRQMENTKDAIEKFVEAYVADPKK
ncbi:CCA tRNA nucleotidyltransferase [Fundicoccus culcitae]|uniref:CCA-adding enzyme n=1 Tax=Fundicoccus culcitae TaxID=2969821 RepID=A0ABY5P7R2_9LACT|nr:CCA tRNA nucleotidyltransferase [Fundicoccus culcitae]UUX34535.1 CCA tRNA nucleotidyltransferase [Fundicoccus culcitae]